MIEYPNYLDNIFDKLQKNGATPMIVGGYVRDYCLNLGSKKSNFSKDIDIEVYNVNSFEKLESILKEFGSVNSVGKSFGVCKLRINNLNLDFTLPRIDNKTSSGHTGFNISVQSNLDFKTASSRRDFTINAIGYNTTDKKIVDPYNGRIDLKNRLLRAVNINTFSEDPLRVLRAIQLSARFNLSVDKELFRLCKNMIKKGVIDELPKERIFEEIKKLLLKADKPSIGFNLLKEFGALEYFFELKLLTSNEWEHLLVSIDELAKHRTANTKTNTVLMLAALCYSFNSTSATSFIEKLTNDKSLLKRVLPLTEVKILHSYNDAELFRLATKVSIKEFVVLNKAIYINLNNELYNVCNDVQKRATELNILNKKATPILRGRDILALGLTPSKDFSKILNLAYEAQMNGEFTSKNQAVKWLKGYLLSNNFRS